MPCQNHNHEQVNRITGMHMYKYLLHSLTARAQATPRSIGLRITLKLQGEDTIASQASISGGGFSIISSGLNLSNGAAVLLDLQDALHPSWYFAPVPKVDIRMPSHPSLPIFSCVLSFFFPLPCPSPGCKTDLERPTKILLGHFTSQALEETLVHTRSSKTVSWHLIIPWYYIFHSRLFCDRLSSWIFGVVKQ